jgi:hypothetical protein
MRFSCTSCGATFQTAAGVAAKAAFPCPGCGGEMSATAEIVELRPDRLPTRRYDADDLRARLEVEKEESARARGSNRSPDQVWFAAVQGRQVGPLTPAGLQGLRARGQLSAATLVWRVGWPAWVAAEAAAELWPVLGLAEEISTSPFPLHATEPTPPPIQSTYPAALAASEGPTEAGSAGALTAPFPRAEVGVAPPIEATQPMPQQQSLPFEVPELAPSVAGGGGGSGQAHLPGPAVGAVAVAYGTSTPAAAEEAKRAAPEAAGAIVSEGASAAVRAGQWEEDTVPNAPASRFLRGDTIPDAKLPDFGEGGPEAGPPAIPHAGGDPAALGEALASASPRTAAEARSAGGGPSLRVLAGGAVDEAPPPTRPAREEARRPFVPALRRTRQPPARPSAPEPEPQPIQVLDLSGGVGQALPERKTAGPPPPQGPGPTRLRRLFSTDGAGSEIDPRLVAVALAVLGALLGIVFLLRGR